MITKREHSEIFFTLIGSWAVYAFCQGDFVVPLIAFLLVGLSYLKEIFGQPSRKTALNFRWRLLIGVALIGGSIWRNFMPEPDNAVTVIPILLPALQTASIIVVVMAWFKFDYRWRLYYLKFLPWLTVATSINVPFNPLTQLLFWSFCLVSIAVMMGQLYFPVSKETREIINKSTCKNSRVYTYPMILAIMAGALFFTLIKSVVLGDAIFMDLIRDYVGFHHFSFFDSTLNLNGAGVNQDDVKPILEIDRNGKTGEYLVGQVFEQYDNGFWKAGGEQQREPLPTNLNPSRKSSELLMYEYIPNIIPAPRGVEAMSTKSKAYEKDANGIVYNNEERIPKVTFQCHEPSRDDFLSANESALYTEIVAPLAHYLKTKTSRLASAAKDPEDFSRRVEMYFRKNFEYSLYVNFRADDRGLVYMLERKRPAYCSYFASAMALILRSQQIPARVVAGFMATEVSNFSDKKFVVRGRDAHAWVEAFIPEIDQSTGKLLATPNGELHGRWVRFDPTPASSRWGVLNSSRRVNKIADWIWCSQKRLKAAILDIDPKTLSFALFVVIGFIGLEEVLKKLYSSWRKNRQGEIRREGLLKKIPNQYLSIYRNFEEYLRKVWKIEREDSDTDTELVNRMRSLPEMTPAVIANIECFLKKYQDARFGMRKDVLLIWEVPKKS